MEDICDGVKILCERMDTNPEDFDYEGKFYTFGNEIDEMIIHPEKVRHRLTFFTQTERDMLTTAYKNFVRAHYTRQVIETLTSTAEVEQPKPSKKGGPLTRAKIINESLAQLNTEFDKSYITYRAKDRYAFGDELPDPWKK